MLSLVGVAAVQSQKALKQSLKTNKTAFNGIFLIGEINVNAGTRNIPVETHPWLQNKAILFVIFFEINVVLIGLGFSLQNYFE